MLAPFDPSSRFPSPRFVVAIPARDEMARLPACLRALDRQRGARCDHVVLVLNNCTDGSAGLVERLRPRLRLPITVANRQFPPEQANAGHARSHAMALAAEIAGSGGVVATTDADGTVEPDWVAGNRAALARGAEAVCGRAVIDPLEALRIAPSLHDDDAREVAYAMLLDQIHGLVDPDPADPLPRHCEHSGASIAVTVAAFVRAGGMQPLPTGEDRGFLRALRLVDARIRHAPEVRVIVSGRLQGRAVGGMADTMARRMIQQDGYLDDDLEPASAALRRAALRARARAAWRARGQDNEVWPGLARLLARGAGLPATSVRNWLAAVYFGQAWARIESESPFLARTRVARPALDREAAAARRILDEIKEAAPGAADGRSGIAAEAAAYPQ